MMPDHPDWAHLDAAFEQALDLDGADREAYLRSLDPTMRATLGPLMDDALSDFPLIDRPKEVLDLLSADDETEVAEGVRVGPYRIEDLVGEGGMGRVYRARRADGAFDQTVAVKVVRQSLALAGSDVAARLQRERALLATLDHPGIARLIDGGETDDGAPYLVTEFVDGAPLTTFADARGLGVRDRVRLLAEVARAVDHAHRRFVVHRDLKPSNVLVTERDGAPRPVVLDFGIAKLLEAADEATGAFPLTRTGMRMLTPAYAAPELYEPTATVTTAADVYGLGALLYELLTGRRPHDDAPTAGPATSEPTRPSRAATTSLDGSHAPADAQRRSRALRGDLDTICLKALHPDPARRYASAAAFADDLGRYLDGRPVEARRDSMAYVAGRFVRRNRATALAAVVAVLALVGGLGVSLAALADEREALAAAEAEALRAERSADTAMAASGVLVGVFSSANPELMNGEELTARQALDLGLEQVTAIEAASLRGYLLTMFGSTYQAIGELTLGDSLLSLGVILLDEESAPALGVVQAYYSVARSRGQVGRYAEALDYMERAYDLADRRLDWAVLRDSPLNLQAVLGINLTRDLAWVHRELGHYDESIEWANRGIQMVRDGLTDSKFEMSAAYELGLTYSAMGRHDDAVATLRNVLALSEQQYGRDHRLTAHNSGALAGALGDAGKPDQAIPYERRAVRLVRQTYEEPHHRITDEMFRLGGLLLANGQTRDAAATLDSAWTSAQRIEMDPYPGATKGLADLAVARNRLGEPARAARAARQALRGAMLPADTLQVARARGQLGVALVALGRAAEARPHAEAAHAAFRTAALPASMAAEAREVRSALASVRRTSAAR